MRLISVIIVLALVSCKKDKPVEPEVSSSLQNGIAVLCEGLFQQNNSTLSWVNLGTGSVSNSLFVDRAGRQLGDTGNDMQRYGGKVYIVVNVSSTIEVMDAATFAPLKQISMIQGGTAKQPRALTFHNGKVYVTCYDGFVDVIDTTSLTVENRIAVGLNPEASVIANGKLYVTNSGGLNAPSMDSTVSVIDVGTQAELQKITVGLNPGGIEVDAQGDVYVIARGDYGSVPSRMVRIDSQTDMVVEQFAFDASGISTMNANFLISYYNFSSGTASIGLFNPQTETMEVPNFVNMGNVSTLYGVHYRPATDQIYLLDAMNFTNTGYVRVFGSGGSYQQSYHVGLNPTKLVFYD